MKVAFITISFGENFNKSTSRLVKSIRNHIKGHDGLDCHVISDISTIDDAIVHQQACEYGSPAIKLKKMESLLKIEDCLRSYDLIYIIDSDCIVIKDIDLSEIVPKNKSELVCAIHPWQVTGKNDWLLEGNQDSNAYIQNTEYYVQSCFWGGYTESVIKAVYTINEWIQADIKNGITSRWYEESYLNKYIHDKPFTLISKMYNFPYSCYSREKLQHDIKIVHFNQDSGSQMIFEI